MKLIKNIIFIIIAFFALDYLISVNLHKISSASNIRYSRLFNQSINADVIFIGNSRAVNTFYTPYIEKKFGFQAINLAYNGLSAPIMELFIDEYLQRNEVPGMIVLEVTALKSDYDILKNFKQYYFDSDALMLLLKEHYPRIYYASKLSRTFAYNSEYFLRTLYYFNRSDQDWINRYQIKTDFYETLQLSDKKLEILKTVDKQSMDSLLRIINLCKQHNINFKLVLAPILDKVRNKDDIAAYLKNIEDRTHLEVVDLSAVINETSYFSDTIHTNEKGAKKLADYFQKIKFFDTKEGF